MSISRNYYVSISSSQANINNIGCPSFTDARTVMAPSNSTTESSAVTRPHVVDAIQQDSSNARNPSSDDRPLDPSTEPTEHDTESSLAPVNQDNIRTADQTSVSGTGIRHNSFICTDNTDVEEDYRTMESLNTTKKALEKGDITVNDNIPIAASNIINSEENTTTLSETSSEPVTESIAHSTESGLGPSSGSLITHNAAVTRPHVVDAIQQDSSNTRNQSPDDRPPDPNTEPTEHNTGSPLAPVNQDDISTTADQTSLSGTNIRHNSFRCTDSTDVEEDYRTMESLNTTKKDLEKGDNITENDNIPSNIGVQDNNIASDGVSAVASNIISSEEIGLFQPETHRSSIYLEENTTAMNETSSEPATESIALSADSGLGPSLSSPITDNGDDGVKYNADSTGSTNNSIDANDGIENHNANNDGTVKTSRVNTRDSELTEATGCMHYVLPMQEDQRSKRLQDKERQVLKDSETTVPETPASPMNSNIPKRNQRIMTQMLNVFQNIF